MKEGFEPPTSALCGDIALPSELPSICSVYQVCKVVSIRKPAEANKFLGGYVRCALRFMMTGLEPTTSTSMGDALSQLSYINICLLHSGRIMSRLKILGMHQPNPGRRRLKYASIGLMLLSSVVLYYPFDFPNSN